MAIFLKALLWVLVAEMGDKTQLLAMAMASKYKAKQVLIGVFIATVFNHAMAVGVGSFLNNMIPLEIVSIVASISFLIFGLWTIRGDKVDEEGEKKVKFGPIVTVAIAFFLAEMGDKTQLMTVAIAANDKSSSPLFILLGTTAGMMVADSIGILAGAWMCRHIPESYIKWGAGIIFMIFGTVTLYGSVPSEMINLISVGGFTLIMGILIYLFGVKFAYAGQVCQLVLKDEVGKETEQ